MNRHFIFQAITPTGLHRLGGRLMLAALLLLAGVLPASAQTAAPSEYQLKAVFLFNFAQFVEWPPDAFDGPKGPLVIGVLGEDPFGTDLDDTVRGEIIGGHPLAVRRFKRVEDIYHCHILFISGSESPRLASVVAALRDRRILTVGDTEGYAHRGVMIRLISEKKRIRLRINLDATKAAGLVVSSKLLRPAEIVSTRED